MYGTAAKTGWGKLRPVTHRKAMRHRAGLAPSFGSIQKTRELIMTSKTVCVNLDTKLLLCRYRTSFSATCVFVMAVGGDLLNLAESGAVTLVHRVAPSISLYAGAAALVLTVLTIWWWAERDIGW
jgi:hypothetical protein